MKRFMLLFLALLLSTAMVAVACPPPPKVTLCHNGNTITVAWEAAFGQAGHFYENGAPRVGHETDSLGECPPPPTEEPTEPPVEPTEPPVVPTVDDPEQYLFNIQWDGDPTVLAADLCFLDGSGCLGPTMKTEIVLIDGSYFAQVDFILEDWYDLNDLAAFSEGLPLGGWYRAGYGEWVYREPLPEGK